ncbi:MAG: hypothetical protein ACJ78Q_19650 [Chloroflexia bacterium]
MMLENKKTGFFRGCIVPILGLVGFIILCFLFCEVVYLLGNVGTGTTVQPTTTDTGGMVLSLLPFLG